MSHSDDAYAAMLLTMALSPNREEYTKPLCVQEFRRFEAAVRASRFRSIGALLDVDISGMMMYLGMNEEESYRIYTLMHRGVQLSYALDAYEAEGIDVVTQYDEAYPGRLESKLAESAPPFLYRCGNVGIMKQPAIAVMGISGVKTAPEAHRCIEALVRWAIGANYAVITGGEPGISRLAAGMTDRFGGQLVELLAGGMRERLADEIVTRMVSEGRAALLSCEHPDALFTTAHAVSRNRLLFALADAAFIFNTDGRRGDVEALQNRMCDWIYAWEKYAGNDTLIARGAVPFKELSAVDMDKMSRHWSSSRSQQLSVFDSLQE